MNRTVFTQDIISLLRGQYGERIKVFETEIPYSIRAVETSSEGKASMLMRKTAKVAAAYDNFTKEVIGLEKQRQQNRTESIR